MRVNKILMALLLSLPLSLMAQVRIPMGYEVLSKSPANGAAMQTMVLLFDTDSIQDTTLLVENVHEFSKYSLLIYLTSQQKQYEIALFSTFDASVYPLPIKISKNVIEYGYYEDGTAGFARFIKLRLDQASGKIQVIGYDVEYKASPTISIHKSYNLLTAKYLVTKTRTGGSGPEVHEEYVGTNTNFQKKVFLENLDLDMLVELDAVGSEFE